MTKPEFRNNDECPEYPPVTPGQLKEYRRRLEYLRKHPESAMDWRNSIKQLRKSMQNRRVKQIDEGKKL